MSRTCVTMDHHNALARTDPNYATSRRRLEVFTATRRVERSGVVRIPVVVHVLWHDEAQNISDDQIRSQIEVLNADYRARNADLSQVPAPFVSLVVDPQIEFQLAVRDPDGKPTTGITRTRTALQSFQANGADLPLLLDRMIKFDGTGKSPWPTDRYLNIWVCQLANGLLGYAQFPGGPPSTDGVVILHSAFGTTGTAQAPFDKGRTTTHEIGHYFNLLHIWGDDAGGCARSDNVTDTPNQAGPNTGTPTYPHVSCGNAPHGDLFMSFMDYVDDAAMVMFTQGQVARMNATLLGERASLTTSDALHTITRVEVLADVGPGDTDALRTLVLAAAPTDDVFDGVEWTQGR